jgi:hypothetical protein
MHPIWGCGLVVQNPTSGGLLREESHKKKLISQIAVVFVKIKGRLYGPDVRASMKLLAAQPFRVYSSIKTVLKATFIQSIKSEHSSLLVSLQPFFLAEGLLTFSLSVLILKMAASPSTQSTPLHFILPYDPKYGVLARSVRLLVLSTILNGRRSGAGGAASVLPGIMEYGAFAQPR